MHKKLHPAKSAPAPIHTDLLDCGNTSTPEGCLNKSALCRASSAFTAATRDNAESAEIVPGATGALKPAYRVLSMTGVGKTVALQGLAHDEEVKEPLDGGVLYMRFGRDAKVGKAIREISKFIALTGAIPSAKKGESATYIADTVNFNASGFVKKCLSAGRNVACEALAAHVLSVPSCWI